MAICTKGFQPLVSCDILDYEKKSMEIGFVEIALGDIYRYLRMYCIDSKAKYTNHINNEKHVHHGFFHLCSTFLFVFVNILRLFPNISVYKTFVNQEVNILGRGPYLLPGTGNCIRILWQKVKCIRILGHKWFHVDSDHICLGIVTCREYIYLVRIHMNPIPRLPAPFDILPRSPCCLPSPGARSFLPIFTAPF